MNRSKVRVRVRVRVRCSTTCDNLGLRVMTMVRFASQCILLHNIKIVTLLISDVILAVYQYHNYGLFYLVFFMFLVFFLFSCVSSS